MTTLDHVGFAVADYQRSKAFYEKALAPLGLKLLMEFFEASAGFGKADGERPSFFIEADGEPVRGRLHIALRAESRAHVHAFYAAAIEAGGTDNGAPGPRWYHPDYYGGYVLDPDGNKHRGGLPPARLARPASDTLAPRPPTGRTPSGEPLRPQTSHAPRQPSNRTE